MPEVEAARATAERRITAVWCADDPIVLRRRLIQHLASARRLPPPDNRWQRGAIVEALYLANDEATVWAEWYRHLADAGIPPSQQMPRDLWPWGVDPGVEVADLTSHGALEAGGPSDPAPRVEDLAAVPGGRRNAVA